MTHRSSEVPTLDIRRDDPAHPEERASLVREVRAAYETYGFCSFVHHGLNQKVLDQAYENFRRFFALPLDQKLTLHRPGTAGARGYTPYKVETAKDSQLADLKEFWHTGRENIPLDSPNKPFIRENLWPDALVPSFKETTLALYQVMDQFGCRVLRLLAEGIDLDEEFFVKRTREGNTILRALHYPPVQQADAEHHHVRASAHEDISLITLLAGATADGLEVKTLDGRWVPIPANSEAIVVNVGDMMQRWTNGVYRSTTHRVTNPAGAAATTSRYSVPFFIDPEPTQLLTPIASCITHDRPQMWPPITSHDYLMQRMREIRLA
jgi:isopenicillin N synthase-like dioxygenase